MSIEITLAGQSWQNEKTQQWTVQPKVFIYITSAMSINSFAKE